MIKFNLTSSLNNQLNLVPITKDDLHLGEQSNLENV